MKILKNNFYDLGFVTGSIDQEYLKEFDQYDFPDTAFYDKLDFMSETEELDKLNLSLDKLQTAVEKNVLNEIFKKYERHNREIWSGMDEPTTKFHNDGIEGHDFSFLIYLDKKNDKNLLEIKNPLGIKTFYPGEGEFIIINQHKMFLHRAENGEGVRRVISFEYKFNNVK